MKKIDQGLEWYLLNAPKEMEADGYRRLSPYVLEKDVLVTEIISSLAGALSYKDYRPVFCGGTCLSKAHGALDRMSEDVDFKIVHADNYKGVSKNQVRKDLSQFKGLATKALESIGYSSSDLKITAKDGNQYVVIEAFYESMFERDQSLREPIQLELNATSMQIESTGRPVSRIIDPWLHESARPASGPVHCVSLLEAVAEKLIAFPRRYAHYHRQVQRGDDRAFDKTLVRHLYDVTQLNGKFPHIGTEKPAAVIRRLMQNLILKDGLEFHAQHPEFVNDAHAELRWAMGAAKSQEMGAHYAAFLEDMVYAPKEQHPSFEETLHAFNGLLSPSIAGDSPNVQAHIEEEKRKQEVAQPPPKAEKVRAPKKTQEEWMRMQQSTAVVRPKP